MMQPYGRIRQGETMNPELRLRSAPGPCLVLICALAQSGAAPSRSMFAHAMLGFPKDNRRGLRTGISGCLPESLGKEERPNRRAQT